MFLFLLTEKKNTKSWERIPASLACGRAKMPPGSLALAAEAINCHLDNKVLQNSNSIFVRY